jgi:hypothetical protein
LNIAEEPVDIAEEPVDIAEEPVDIAEEPVDIAEEPVDTLDDEKEQYYTLINEISMSLSSLLLNTRAYRKFTGIIASSFQFTKCALLVFSPPEQKFIHWDSINLDSTSKTMLQFDLNFNDVYKRLTREKSFCINKNDEVFNSFRSVLSSNDFDESGFQLWVPLVFSARIIGVFVGLQREDGSLPSRELQNAMEIIGRLNGPLLYNILQKQQMEVQQKKK